MAAIITHYALRLSRRTRCIENIKRVRCRDGDAVGRFCRRHLIRPIEIMAIRQIAGLFFTLQNHAGGDLMAGQSLRFVQQRLVRNDSPRLDPAGRRENYLRRAIIDPCRQLVGGKSTKDDRMDRAQTRACEHGNRRFRHHRHVDDDPVALLDTVLLQDARALRDRVAQFRIGVSLLLTGDRTVVNQRQLVGTPLLHMPVDGVETGVTLRSHKPAIEGWIAGVQQLIPLLLPMNGFGGFHPKPFRIRKRTVVDFIETAHGVLPKFRRRRQSSHRFLLLSQL